jgi:serine/threonine protein kinase/regulator of sirC expression with transglutaminase-like and TPR domain
LNFFEKLGMKPAEQPLGGRYQVIEKLGAGGFGQTFLAQDLHLPGHPVCVIKQFHPQRQDDESLKTARRLFNTEAEVLYKLGSHPQIPRLLAHFEDRQEFYLAQEYVAGRSLGQVLVEGQPWPQERVIALLLDLLQILAIVHQQKVIHRDIKPSNLLCRDRDRHIVLIDFGAVKQVNTQFLQASSGNTNLTVSIGTQGYMPNEQLAGSPRFSSDVYAVGIIGIQALTGVHPKHFRQDPRLLELQWRNTTLDVDTNLADVLDRMVRYDFRARYPTAADALAALQSLPAPLLATLPEHWYSPQAVLPDTPPDTATTSTLATAPAAPAAPTASMALPPASGHSPSTQVAIGRRTGRTFGPQKPKGSTVVVSSLIQALPRHNWLLAGTLLGLAASFVLFRACTSSPPVTTTANAALSASTDAAGDPVLIAEDLVQQAEQQRQAGQYGPALNTFDQAIEHNPDLAVAHWGRCYSLNQLQQFEAAMAACDRASALAPEDPRPLSSKGFALQQQQQYAAALALFDQALTLQPDDPGVWNNRGTALLQMQQPQAALEAFDRATELQPDFAEAWNNRGAALWSLRQFDDAANSIDRAIELKPDYADALSLREQIRSKRGHQENSGKENTPK